VAEPRGVFDLLLEPPDVIVLDTSAVAVVLFEDQDAHAEYAQFLARAVQAGTTLVYCEMLDLELAQVCMKAARKEHDGRRERFVPAGRTLIRDVFGRWRALYSETGSLRVPVGPSERRDTVGSPVRDAAFHLIERYGIDSYDATHAATAVLFGAPLVCADNRFAHVPEEVLTMITDSARVVDCRAIRERAAATEVER
jgi:predicted nucleic acid-binding protein